MNGLKKGLSLIGQAWNMRRRAEKSGNTELVAALNGVMNQFVSEIFQSTSIDAKDAKINYFALLIGADLFVQSRLMFQQVQAKYPGA